MTQLLDDDEISERLRSLEWTRDGEEIVREFAREDFTAAIAFVDRVAEVAEA